MALEDFQVTFQDRLIHTFDLPPTQHASHHQDYPFLGLGIPINSFATVTGWGVDPIHTKQSIVILSYWTYHCALSCSPKMSDCL